MKPHFLEQAQGRLKLCRRAIVALEEARISAREFQVHWLDFLIQWKGTYMKVQQAAKDTPQELQWFGAVNTERRRDPLLRYLYEARNDEEHGLALSASHSPNLYHVRAERDYSGEFLVRPVGPTEIEVFGSDGKPIGQQIGFELGTSKLEEITEKDGKRKVPPPTKHLGEPMASEPMVAASLGLRWLEALVLTAEAMSRP